uniref:Uncharacterized protein n=1 Tax=Anguilla anguilla TaxID=7936 RepID=A0A0E9PD66_ANGAN
MQLFKCAARVMPCARIQDLGKTPQCLRKTTLHRTR